MDSSRYDVRAIYVCVCSLPAHTTCLYARHSTNSVPTSSVTSYLFRRLLRYSKTANIGDHPTRVRKHTHWRTHEYAKASLASKSGGNSRQMVLQHSTREWCEVDVRKRKVGKREERIQCLPAINTLTTVSQSGRIIRIRGTLSVAHTFSHLYMHTHCSDTHTYFLVCHRWTLQLECSTMVRCHWSHSFRWACTHIKWENGCRLFSGRHLTGNQACTARSMLVCVW